MGEVERRLAGRPVSGKRLTPDERGLLHDIVLRRAPELESSMRSILDGKAVPPGEYEAIRDTVGDELLESGIDEHLGAVNERGRRLDALIDSLAAMERAVE